MNRVFDFVGNVCGLIVQKVNFENVFCIVWCLSGFGELIEFLKDEGGWCFVIEWLYFWLCFYCVEGKMISEIMFVNVWVVCVLFIELVWFDLVVDGWLVDIV